MRFPASRYTIILSLCSLFFLKSNGQRVYRAHSVLATGTWYKIAIDAEGIYKMDLSFLSGLGITGRISSNEIGLFGKNANMLPEANNDPYVDDLEEIAVEVVDGGDGILNGADYILFYAQGPQQWIKDSANRRFNHKKNLYSDQSFYYLTIGGTGKRIALQTVNFSTTATVTAYDERFFYELDSVNFLSSGKEWFGPEFSNLPGHSLTRQFTLPGAQIPPGTTFTIVSNLIARSVNTASRFDILLNDQLVQQHVIPPVGAGPYDVFAQQVQQAGVGTLSQNDVHVTFRYLPGSFNAQGWLNWFEAFYRKQLLLPVSKQLLFRDWNSAGTTAVTFKVGTVDGTAQVWDITQPLSPVKMNTIFNGTELTFTNEAQSVHEYVCFSSSFLIPQAAGRVANQDLHHTSENDYIIITHASLLAQAKRLAQFHQQRSGLRTLVVTTEQIFNEFAAGIADPVALRDFVKMYYDKYRTTWSSSGKYLCLFGRASFDYKNRLNNNTNLVPAYQSVSSLDPLSTYTSDDFFGFLDDEEDINSGLLINKLDIGIGRVPAKNADEAKNFVDKIDAYHSATSLGPWRNNLNFIADDEDFNLHVQDTEIITATTSTTAPAFNLYKIYLDAYRQEGSSAGGRYPQANAVINNNIYNGTLIWNYTGHGGSQRLAEEVVIDQQIVNNWSNAGRLPLFITATCDFAPFDNPSVPSLGENLLLRPKTGAVALMTTTRVVFAFNNRILNNNYLQFALQPNADKRYKTLGEAIQVTKNFTYQTSGDIINNRKFTLLGDPAMTLGFPQVKVKALTVNGNNVLVQADTLSAAEFVSVEGEVTDQNDNRINSFNGTVYLSLFDKPQLITTLANDATSQPLSFATQTSALFKGKVSVINGKFTFGFRLPKDINYQFGFGKLSLYAQNGIVDGNGFSQNVIIGGISSGGTADKEGPVIAAYLNDERFVNGSITNENPVLLLKLSDSSGINTGNAGIDHDIIATLDNDNRKYYVLNDFYEAALDSYQLGTLRFQLPELSPGRHTLKIKAWDVLNNSSEYVLEFIVASDEELVLDHVLNYPNPFTTKTAFWFEHNKPAIDLQVRIEIFTITGKIIKTINRTINTEGNRSTEAEWDGRDEFGERIGRGVYLYRIIVQSPNGRKTQKLQRLVIIK